MKPVRLAFTRVGNPEVVPLGMPRSVQVSLEVQVVLELPAVDKHQTTSSASDNMLTL